ncbi:transposase [Planctopirus hydrillae]|uniref:transposase n=1 Tax=Planctopirus hydrillae TaxID=1841610 RepID=UPI000DA10DCF|nr:transposase [Planctopirus hydrillae]
MDAHLPDTICQSVMNMLPEQSPSGRWGGRPPISHDIVLRVIWFVLTTGCRWRKLPAGMGCSGETARTRLAHWQELGIWWRLHASILTQLHRTQALNLDVVIVDSTHVRAF